jgi:hypothetical protein
VKDIDPGEAAGLIVLTCIVVIAIAFTVAAVRWLIL